MSEELDSAVSSLSEQTKKMNIALHYVNGDMQKAKQMVAGSYKDLYVLKCSFTSSSLNGVFIIFYNHMQFKVINLFTLVAPSYSMKKINSHDEWVIFEKESHAFLASGENDDILSRTLRDKIFNSFSIMFITDLNRFLTNNEEISLNRLFQKLIQDALGLQRVECDFSYQLSTSLDMEMNSITSRKLDRQTIEGQPQAAAEEPAGKEEVAGGDPKIGVDGIKLIINCSLILSPIKGKEISKIVSGDRIRVNIVDKNPKAITVAQAFNAYSDGKFSPINVRVKSVDYHAGIGYVLYVVVAKGILGKIVEEEENIKVAMDPTYFAEAADEVESKSNLPVIMIILTAIGVAVLVILALLKML